MEEEASALALLQEDFFILSINIYISINTRIAVSTFKKCEELRLKVNCLLYISHRCEWLSLYVAAGMDW